MEELRLKPVDELLVTGENFRAELFALKFQAAVGSLEKTHRINELKKEIARIELVLGEKRRAGENVNKTLKGDYQKAVAEAEKTGKAVRKKQLEKLEELQKEQFGGLDEEALAEAMKNGEDEGVNK